MGLERPWAVGLFEWIVSQDARIATVSLEHFTVVLTDPRQLPQRCGPC